MNRPFLPEEGMPIRPVEEERDAEDCRVGVGDANELEFQEDLDVETGARVPKKLADPKLPNEEEVRVHEFTHLPYRSWCAHCVRGKGKALDHRRQQRQHNMKEVHVDYCFMGSAKDNKTRCIIVGKEPESKYIVSSVVPMKGASHEFPARRLCAFLRGLGLEHQDVTLKSDQEAAIKDLLQEVAKQRIPANTFFEESPVGASASNGVIERGNQTVEGQIRVLKDALEARLGDKVPSDHNILCWLVEFAAVLVNRYEVGHDGKTPYERLRGKSSKLLGLEFGEQLHFRRTRHGGRLAKLDVSWQDGVFLGYRSASGEIIIGTRRGRPENEDRAAKAGDREVGQEEPGHGRRSAVAAGRGRRRGGDGHAGDQHPDAGAGRRGEAARGGRERAHPEEDVHQEPGRGEVRGHGPVQGLRRGLARRPRGCTLRSVPEAADRGDHEDRGGPRANEGRPRQRDGVPRASDRRAGGGADGQAGQGGVEAGRPGGPADDGD